MTRSALPRAEPAGHGVDPAGIHAFLDAAGADALDLHSFMLFRCGAVVAEGFWRPYAADIPHALHSATKSWTSAAIGLAVDDGAVGLDDTVIKFFPEHLPETVSDNLAAMTLRDLLTMRTGHATGISGGAWRGLRESWIAAFLREPVPAPPGTDFIYSSASSYMLSAIVTRATGQTMHDYLAPRLLRPLGMAPVRWDLSPEGISTGGNGLTCHLEDLLKFGVLHLQRGLWDGTKILSPQWVDEATSNHVAHAWLGALDGRRYTATGAGEKREGYGYQWWMERDGAYRASGVFGQHCIVLPRHDAVIAFTAGLGLRDPRLLDHVWQHLVPAMADGATPDDGLAGRLTALAAALPDAPVQAACRGDITSCRWQIEPNEDQVETVSLHFSADTCRFELRDHRGTHTIDVGLGRGIDGETSMTGHKLHHEYQPPALRVLASGTWPDPNCFRMTWRFIETAFTDTVTIFFEGDRLRLDREVNTNAGPTRLAPILGSVARQ